MLPTLTTYTFGPFSLQSELPLPELPESSSAGLPVNIKLGDVPASVSEPTFSTPFCTASREQFLLRIPDVATYHIREGCEVIVQAAAGSDVLDVRGYLLGTIFAVLCHQRRLLPLHASAVRMGSSVVAFLGDSGAGKSTLAAFLVERGFPLVADDVCLLDPDATALERVIPVAPWLKLWRKSLEALGKGEQGLTRTFNDEDKFRVPVFAEKSGEARRLPLAALVILKNNTEPGATAGLHRLGPAPSVVEAMRFTYQQYLLNWLGLQEEHFKRTSIAIANAAVYTCDRPWGFESMNEVGKLLEDHFGRPE